MPDSDLLTVEQAHQLLKQFDCLQSEPKLADTYDQRDRLQQALLQMASQSDHHMLGICADTFAQGYQTLQAYAQALGHSLDADIQPIEGAVYFKFNPKLGSCYVAPYSGEHRGVLIACQSTADTGINEMYGHLPLDLFEALV